MSNSKISEEYKRYQESSVMKKIAQDAHGLHYCGQTSSATLEELCQVLHRRVPKHNEKILDAGCGNGCFSLEIAAKYSLSVDGIDLSHDLIDVATTQSLNRKLEHVCNFHVGDFSEIQGDNLYGLILSVGSLYWNQDLKKTFSSWNRLLSKNGHIIVFSNLENASLTHEEQALVENTKFIKIDTMKSLAKECGFTNEYEHDGTEKYYSWLSRWHHSMSTHLNEIIEEMGDEKTHQLVSRFTTYLKLASQRKVLRKILVFRKKS